MKHIKFYILTATVFLTLLSCQDDEKERIAATKKMEQQNDSILKVVDEHWNFTIPKPTAKVAESIKDWNEWELFTYELFHKPTGTITAYRQKTENLINKVNDLKTTIPPFYNKQQIKSRILVLDTKVKSLYNYINLDVIQCDKVTALIKEIREETISIQNQMDEMIRISEIPVEEGEAEMLKAIDTVRMASPDKIQEQKLLNPKGIAPAGNNNDSVSSGLKPKKLSLTPNKTKKKN